MVPVIAIGFDDLRNRVDAQTSQASEQTKRLADLKSRISTLSTLHAVSNASRLLRAATAQTQLTQRLMAFIQHLHLMIPSVRSSSLRPEEEALRGQLEEIEELLRRGRFKAKVNEMWALIGALGANSDRSRGSGGEWAVVDEDGLAQIAQVSLEWVFLFCRVNDVPCPDSRRPAGWAAASHENFAESPKRPCDCYGKGAGRGFCQYGGRERVGRRGKHFASKCSALTCLGFVYDFKFFSLRTLCDCCGM